MISMSRNTQQEQPQTNPPHLAITASFLGILIASWDGVRFMEPV
jgi:hypothetical protein